MPDARPWYREPETFIAIAALVVSVSAVVVGIYEASLQRAHDRAEVWPHVEISTFISGNGASVGLQNNGIGPAVIKSIVVTVDGRPRRDWPDVVQALLAKTTANFASSTVVDRGVRAGDKVEMLGLPRELVPPEFWKAIARVGVVVCYSSVFDQFWEVSDKHLGSASVWRSVEACPAQTKGTDF